MKAKIILVVLILLVAGAGVLFFWLRNHGFSAREEPSWIEAKMARHARKIATPAGAKGLTNPITLSETNLGEAREHWVEHCSMCHGVDGRGEATLGRNLYPKAPNMLDTNTQQLTDGELFYIISNGVRFTGMPAWGGEDSPESIWGLVAFIRRLPQLSPEEIRLMEEIAAGAGEPKAGEGEGQLMDKMPETTGTKENVNRMGDQKRADRGRHKSAKPHAH